MTRLPHVFAVFLLACVPAFAGNTDAELQAQRKALRNLELSLSKQRKQVKQLASKEQGVLTTISTLDRNLNETREYVVVLAANETAVNNSLTALGTELDSLDRDIALQECAMERRIRELYMKGATSEFETLYKLMRGEENPERNLYMVRRLLTEDRDRVEKLRAAHNRRTALKQKEAEHLEELHGLRTKKAEEEHGLVGQIQNQNAVLDAVKRDKNLQQQALKEYESNQRAMLAIINMLEQRRKREIEEQRKREQEEARRRALAEAQARKNKGGEKGPEKTTPKQEVTYGVPIAAGPKCLPLKGPVISNYGLQEHPVLHIMTKNLGVEIRGKRGDAIHAAAPGKVAMVTEIDGRGPSVIIEHAGGVFSVYGHLSSIRVKEGMNVRSCEEIGEVGDIASLNGIKLYFQVSEGTRTVDPLHWLNTK
ncbi:MAG: peptidoglycan DD-metalloendopeptidase family protein [Fibrobacteraceae bacterium]